MNLGITFDTVYSYRGSLGFNEADASQRRPPRVEEFGEGVAIGDCQVSRIGGLPVVIIPLQERLYGRGREWFSNSALNLFLFPVGRDVARAPATRIGVNMLIHGI